MLSRPTPNAHAGNWSLSEHGSGTQPKEMPARNRDVAYGSSPLTPPPHAGEISVSDLPADGTNKNGLAL